MSSPVGFDLKKIILLDKEGVTPLYLQIAQQIINGIQRGILLVGGKLPGSRILAQTLGVHRKTVVAALQELELQGWLLIKPNVGTYIINPENLPTTKVPTYSSLAAYPKATGFVFNKSDLLHLEPEIINEKSLVCTDGTPDLRLSYFSNLTQGYSASLKRKTIQNKLATGHLENVFFKSQLTNFLNVTRGLHILPENVLVTRSTEMSLFILSQTLLQPLDKVVVAELSYYKANMIFQQAGAKLVTIPVDALGLDVEALRMYVEKNTIRAVYVTPQHHYPTTVTLSAERRLVLLELATKHNFVIIEDDYDYDFQYDKSAMLPLCSADLNGMVVYTGTFGKALFPNFRTGFIVAPANFIKEARKYLHIIDPLGDVVLEHVLAEIISEGDMHRYIKKAVKEYKLRRDFTIDYINRHLNDWLEVTCPSGGLALWLTFKQKIALVDLTKYLKENHIILPRICQYQNKSVTAIRLGFGNLNINEFEQIVTQFQLYLKTKA